MEVTCRVTQNRTLSPPCSLSLPSSLSPSPSSFPPSGSRRSEEAEGRREKERGREGGSERERQGVGVDGGSYERITAVSYGLPLCFAVFCLRTVLTMCSGSRV
eukprot:605223-Rhodomonas_salina.1